MNKLLSRIIKDNKERAKNQQTYDFFSTRGRVGRRPFWMFILIVTLGAVILSFFEGVTFNIQKINDAQMIFFLFMFWPSVAILAKRWHDLNKSGLWVLIMLIPVIGPIWTLYEAGFMPGATGTNEFGPDPLKRPEK